MEAFSNGDLAENVYMKPSPCYSNPPGKVSKLCNALNGLKQAHHT